jgi:hypothetical protein
VLARPFGVRAGEGSEPAALAPLEGEQLHERGRRAWLASGMAPGTRPGLGSLNWEASLNGVSGASNSGHSDPNRLRAGLMTT